MARIFFILLCFLALPASAATSGKPLVADLSSSRIELNSRFTGTDLLLFGARNGNGDIVVVVRGPERSYLVRKKERVLGIWVNKEQMLFRNVPDYYSIASSKAFLQIKNPFYFKPLQIGLANVVETPLSETSETYREFYNALLRIKMKNKLYSPEPGAVTFLEETLFKTFIPFPDTIPGGTYTAEAYLFSDGQLTGMESTPVHVLKTGFEAFIYDLAHNTPALYGFFCIVFAIGAGWGASALFERFYNV